jgi:hypothetical protein
MSTTLLHVEGMTGAHLIMCQKIGDLLDNLIFLVIFFPSITHART